MQKVSKSPISANEAELDTAIGASGFGEQQSIFETASLDHLRFRQSLELMRSFGLIEEDVARQQVLDLARRLVAK